MAAGLGVELCASPKAVDERDNANRQTAIASSINRFLSDDLLVRGNPFVSGKSSESLMDAVKQASPGHRPKIQGRNLW